MVLFPFDNSYAREMEGFYLPWQGDTVPDPQMIRFNHALAAELGLPADTLDGPEGAAILSGTRAPEGAVPLAMAYAGHQFGGFSPQLGDGRAVLLGEVLDQNGARRDIHLKGSGRTPFSRGGDGKAVIGPVLREYLIGEAMHALGVPSTRALAAVATGEQVLREGAKPGAVLARVAASHLRVGTFQFFAARGEADRIKQLADYAIARHYPDFAEGADRYLGLLRAVRDAQAALVAKWVALGFVHGVMNTDNVTISGETIDYGPCAFMDRYDPGAVFSSIDHGGRYAYGNQPTITQWNLARFAETLIGLVDPEDSDAAIAQLTTEINAFPAIYQTAWLEEMRQKLGLAEAQEGDLDLINDLHTAMERQGVDFTSLFRSLSDVVRGQADAARGLFIDPTAFDAWLPRFAARAEGDSEARAAAMDRVNPLYIPRNHLVEAALQQAEAGEMAAFHQMLDVVTQPFVARADWAEFAKPAPLGAGPYVTFCGT